MTFLHAAFCLTLSTPPIAPTDMIRVDWSAAAGTDAPIAGVRRDYVAGFNARRRVLEEMYTADAVAILADGAHVGDVATAASRPVALTDGSAGTVTITLVPRRFVVTGDTGSETGTFVETYAIGDKSTIVEGMYVTIYAHTAEGQWRIAMDLRTRGGRTPLAIW